MTNLVTRLAVIEAVVVLGLGVALLLREPAPEVFGEEDEQTSSVPAPTASPVAAPSNKAASSSTGSQRTDDSKDTPPPRETIGGDDPVGVILHGSVAGADGSALRSYSLRLKRSDPEQPADTPRSWQFSTERAQPYTFAGVPPARYLLTCRAGGFVPWKQELELSPDSRVRRVDVRLRKKIAIRVRFVTSNGERSTDSQWFDRNAVIATESPIPDRVPILPSGDRRFPTLGAWQPRRGSKATAIAGEMLLTEPPPVYLHAMVGPLRLQSVLVEAQQREAVFTIDTDQIETKTGSLALRLSDAATGMPVPNAFVRVGQVGISPNREGVFQRRRMPPGMYELSIFTRGTYERFTRAVPVEAGAAIDLGTIALTAGTTCSGVVVDARGKAAIAQVIAYSLDRGHRRWPLVPGTSIAANPADGSFELKGLGAGRYLIRAATAGRKQVAHTNLDVGQSMPKIRLVLQPTVPVRLDIGIDPYRRITLCFRDAAGDPVSCQRVGARSKVGPNLLPGVYDVEIFGLDGERSSRLTVGGESPTLEVR